LIRAEWSGTAVSDNRRLIPCRGRSVANPAYKAFKESMAWSIKLVRGDWILAGRVSVRLVVRIPPRMDVSAIIKSALDAIQLAGVILDDNQIDRLLVERMGPAVGRVSRIIFEIEGMENEK
jgi:Holliday junction resolvase RusA-like endonuclease